MAAPDDTSIPKFKIGDQEFALVAPDDFDMEEWEIMHGYSGLQLDDFAIAPDAASTERDENGGERVVGEDGPEEKARQRRIGQPSYYRALLHISYRRANPEAAYDDIKALTGKLKMSELFVVDSVKGDAGPPDSTADSGSAAASSASDSESGLKRLPTSLGELANPHVTTGTRE